ncbi:MAG TPA: MFS transporter [Allosphingosinicella sp.]|nr:MFS transporter [Allosphingosinicella sp.]
MLRAQSALRQRGDDRLSLALPAPCDGAPASGKCRAAKHPRLVLATCILASSLAFIDGSVLNVALPAIGRAFHAGTAEVQWVVNAFLLPVSALLLLGGGAGDLYGRRRVMLWGIALFTAASLLCAAAPSLAIFLGGRALQGLGAAMLMPNSLAILSASFTGEARGRAVGAWAAAGAIAGALAPMLGGWLVDGIGWPAIFLINLPIAAGAILLGLLYVPESENEERPPPDWAGALLATFGLGALTWGLTSWSASDRLDGATAAALGAGAVLILTFLAVERRRGASAMVPLDLFGARAFLGLTLFTFLLYGALGGLMLLLPYMLIEAGGYAAVTAGAALLPLPIVIALGSPPMGRLAARIGPRWPLALGPLLVAAGFALALRIGADGDYWTRVLPAILGVSLGMAIAVAPLTTAVLGAVDDHHVGTASGLNSAVARAGGLIAVALLGIVLSRRGADLIAGFHGAALVGVGLALVASLTALATLRAKPTS